MTGLWRYLLYPLPQTSANPARYLSNFLCSNLSNCQCFFYFHDNLQQVCRPANGHKYSTSFLKLDLDFGSKGRAPTLWSILLLFQKGLSTPALASAILSISYLAQHSWLYGCCPIHWKAQNVRVCFRDETCLIKTVSLDVHLHIWFFVCSCFYLFIIWWKSLTSIHQFISFPCAVSPTEALPVPSALLTQQWQWGAASQRAPNRLLLWHRLTNQHCLSCES